MSREAMWVGGPLCGTLQVLETGGIVRVVTEQPPLYPTPDHPSVVELDALVKGPQTITVAARRTPAGLRLFWPLYRWNRP